MVKSNNLSFPRQVKFFFNLPVFKSKQPKNSKNSLICFYKYLFLYVNESICGLILDQKWNHFRILYHIQRFSEYLDFDCFNLSREKFMNLTNNVMDRLTLRKNQA